MRKEPLTLRIDRRRFLRGVGTVGIGTALVGGLRGTALAADPRRRTRTTAYRLSTHGMDVCGACKAHGAHKYFRTHTSVHRAHHGCNCRILKQQIPRKRWNRFFVQANGSLRGQWDDRW